MSIVDLSGYAPCQMSGQRMRWIPARGGGQREWRPRESMQHGSPAEKRDVHRMERCPMCRQMVEPVLGRWPTWPEHLAKVAAL